MHGKFGLFFREENEQPYDGATQLVSHSCPVCSGVFSSFHTTCSDTYSFTTDGYGILNVRKHVGCVPYALKY